MSGNGKSQATRSQVRHPVTDADGHWRGSIARFSIPWCQVFGIGGLVLVIEEERA